MATKTTDPGTNQDQPDLDSEPEDLPERHRAEDDEPAVEVRSKDGKTEVDVHQESRRERRERERAEQRRKELEEHTAPLRQQLAETHRMLQEMSTRMQQPAATQGQAPTQSQDKNREESRKVAREMESVIATIRAEKENGTLTKERAEELKNRYYDLEDQRADLRMEARLKTYQPPQGPSAHEQMLASQHPDVWFNPRAKAHAEALARAEQGRREFRNGRGCTPAEVIEIQHAALKQAGEELGLTKPNLPAPGPGERARFGGTGATTRGQGGKVTRQLQDHEMEAARVMFPDDTDSVAAEKWYRVAEKNGYFQQS